MPNAKVTGSPALSASPCGLPGYAGDNNGDLKRYGIQTAKAEGAQVNVHEIEASMLRDEFGDA